ncbi:hypothetical protein DXG03_003844 [Asterophora parasitica]|uniref:E3 ubiquitin-protein ligase listerin n=1 Tax=Asterophora parasitica TaxID=117018 RepID=A0A9P7KAJ7_9AGAR|nr:hypothetical protein DXG03_003844 [Asterophora parasitica]
MARGGKSSASSGTRKKHAKKAAGPSQEEEPIPKDNKLTKKQRGQKRKEPRVKVFIPPVKPAPVQPDPLETTGLVHSLPPELLVVLRSFNKKAQVTKIRALEELQSGWIERCKKEGEDGALVCVLVDMIPVWLHHVPALLVHPSRRVRLLAAGAHLSFLQIPPVRDQILLFLREIVSPPQVESILGTWYLAAYDIDKSVSSAALKAWGNAVSFDNSGKDQLALDSRLLSSLVAFIQRTILDPSGVYLYLNPAPPAPPPPPIKQGARKEVPEAASRSKLDELEEDEQDRKARLRVGGLGAIRQITGAFRNEPPGNLIEFFKNPALWSALYHAEQYPFVDIDTFGLGQHNVQFPRAWEIEQHYDYSKDDEDGDLEDEDVEDKKQDDSPKQSIAYQEFLRFLGLGCSGSPLQGYPTVVIILSTIPSSILITSPSTIPLADLFTAFWDVLASRALSSLQRSATSTAFLSSLFECMIFLIKRVRNDARSDNAHCIFDGNLDDFVQNIVREQFGKVYVNLVGKTLKVESRGAARLVAQTLLSLNEIDTALFDTAWDTLSSSLRKAAETDPALLSVFLKVLHDKLKHTAEPRQAASLLMSTILHSATETCVDSIRLIRSGETDGDALSVIGVPLLVNMLVQFREGLFDDSKFSKLIDDLISQHAFMLLRVSSTLILAYLTHRKDEGHCLRLWHALLAGIARYPEKAEPSMNPLLDAVERDILPRYLMPSIGEIDGLIEKFLAQALTGDAAHLSFVQQVLRSADHFLSAEGYTNLLESISSAFSIRVDSALSDSEISLSSFEPTLELISVLSKHPPRALKEYDVRTVLQDIFIFAHILFTCYDSERDHPTFGTAKVVWERWQNATSLQDQSDVLDRIKTKLRVILCDTQLRPFPRDILEVLWSKPLGIHLELPGAIFPSSEEMDQLLVQLSPDPIHPSLAVIDALIPPAVASPKRRNTSQAFDSRGFSTYARVIDALLQVFIEGRQIAKRNVWALQHFQALEVYAQDFINFPSGHSPVFGTEAIHANLESLVAKIEQITTYMLTSTGDEGWREHALTALLESKVSGSSGALSTFLVDTIHRSRDSDSARDIRILRNVLQHVFNDIDVAEADRWILLARKLESTAPETSIALIFAVTNFAPEPPRLERLRNELAANLLGIPPSKANTQGLLALRKLAVSAPNLDSDVVFLPQPRAVNITKACQQWITSDEDIGEDVESAITLVFHHIAPILQDLSGAHWDLMFDVMENNLEVFQVM